MAAQLKHKSIRYRFLKDLSGILFVSTVVLSTVIAVNEGRILNRSLITKGRSFASYIAKRSSDPLIMKDGIQLDSIVSDASKDEDILYAVIHDANGSLTTSQFTSINYRSPRLKAILMGLPKESSLQDIIDAIRKREAVTVVSVPILSGPYRIGEVTICLSQHIIRRQILNIVLFILVLNIAVAVILGYVVFSASRRVLFEPLAELAGATDRLAKGDLTARITLQAADELQVLFDNFNRMAGDLNKTTVSKAYMDNIIEGMINALIVADHEDKIIRANAAACSLLGYREEELKGNSVDMILVENESAKYSRVETVPPEKRISMFEASYRAKGGHMIPVLLSVSVLYDKKNTHQSTVYFAQDFTHRKKAEEQIRYLAYYDSLTGLPNRTFYKELVSRALLMAKRHNWTIAILFIDLDSFKRINDTLGHDIGDQLLRTIGDLVKMCIRESDFIGRSEENQIENVVARLGGDEFIVLLNEIDYSQDASRVARRILKELARPFTLAGHEVFVTASIGIALYPLDSDDEDSLLKNADVALYHAKNQGRNNYQFYTKSMNATSLQRLNLENDLRKALDRGELLLYYQPTVDVQTRMINGAEALIRWNHPNKGMILPGEFIPLAEETGLIMQIGEWVLRTACIQNKEWQNAGNMPFRVAVNLSGRQFDQKGLTEAVSSALRETGLDPRYLELEITESTIMKNPEKAATTLQKLKDMGICLSIDDFGTGYSSLGNLRRFPLDTLKIDRSFVMNITTHSDDAAITTAIIAMAHSLKLGIIAEGVESEDQHSFLHKLKCDTVQGNLFSWPVPAEEFIKLISENKHL